ncbi:MAG TPA: thioesterase family protein [Pirellulaceae bacterium]|nr:thioesterase family protein [Pirellulaceae bacterium]
MQTQHEIEIRVRYQETDAQARVHHANYLTYFEQARVEFLRAAGYSYKALEESGVLLVVAEVNLRYFLPAEYDDLLRIRVQTVAAKGARITHEYHVYRDAELLCQGRTVVACIGRDGRVQRLPAWLRMDREREDA